MTREWVAGLLVLVFIGAAAFVITHVPHVTKEWVVRDCVFLKGGHVGRDC